MVSITYHNATCKGEAFHSCACIDKKCKAAYNLRQETHFVQKGVRKVSSTPHDTNNGQAQPDPAVPRSTTTSWGERLLPYLFAAMEACWLDALMIGLAGASQEFLLQLWIPFVLLLAVCWLATVTTPQLGASMQSATAFLKKAFVVALLVGTTLFSLWSGLYAATIAFYNPLWLGNLVGDTFLLGPNAFHIIGIIVLVCYFYWRGLRLARGIHEPGNVFTALRVGVGILLGVILFRVVTNASANEGAFLLLIPLFLLLALTAHAFAQVSFVRTTYRGGLLGSVFSQERALLGIILGFGAILFVLALLIGAIASPAFLTDAQRIFTPIALFYTGLTYVLAFIISLVAIPLIWLLQSLHLKMSLPSLRATPDQAFCSKYPHSVRCLSSSAHSAQDPGAIFVLIGQIALPLLLLLLIILIIRLLHHRGYTRVTRRVDEVHESLWSWNLFLTQLRTFFLALWLRLFPRPALAEQGVGLEEEPTGEPTARSVREIYRAMLHWAANRGYPRKCDETPYEFRVRLHTRLPFTEPELSIVTEAYTAIRYGRVIPTEAEVANVQQTWSQLRAKIAKMQHEA